MRNERLTVIRKGNTSKRAPQVDFEEERDDGDEEEEEEDAGGKGGEDGEREKESNPSRTDII